MTALPSLLAALTAAIQTHPLCKKVIVLETKEFSPIQFFHHHHDEKGNVSPSSLGGDPIVDLPIVLQNITTFLSQHFEKDGLDDRTAQ